jgi:hypothetical protein
MIHFLAFGAEILIFTNGLESRDRKVLLKFEKRQLLLAWVDHSLKVDRLNILW